MGLVFLFLPRESKVFYPCSGEHRCAILSGIARIAKIPVIAKI